MVISSDKFQKNIINWNFNVYHFLFKNPAHAYSLKSNSGFKWAVRKKVFFSIALTKRKKQDKS